MNKIYLLHTRNLQIGYGLARTIFADSVPMQLGLYFTGISPSGGASNIWIYILGGNLNLSVTITAVSNFVACCTYFMFENSRAVRDYVFLHRIGNFSSIDPILDGHFGKNDIRQRAFGVSIRQNRIVFVCSHTAATYWTLYAEKVSEIIETDGQNTQTVFVVSNCVHYRFRYHYQLVSV